MRTLLLALLVGCLAAGGFALGFQVARRAPASGEPSRRRPERLEAAWRAWFDERAPDLLAALDDLRRTPLEGADGEELRLLAALAAKDEPALERLAEGLDARTPSVIAAARRELARAAPSPQARQAWIQRIRRDTPASWALSAPAAFDPR